MKKLTHKILSGVDDVYISRTGKNIVVVRVYTKNNRLKQNSNYYPNNSYNNQIATKFFGRIYKR